MNELPNSETRKAAILLTCLEEDQARMLLRNLNRNTAREVLNMTLQLQDVTSVERENVLSEFLDRQGRQMTGGQA